MANLNEIYELEPGEIVYTLEASSDSQRSRILKIVYDATEPEVWQEYDTIEEGVMVFSAYKESFHHDHH